MANNIDEDSTVSSLKLLAMSGNDLWIDIQLDSTGRSYVASRNPSSVGYEGVNGTLLVRISWASEAKTSDYRPSDGDVMTAGFVAGTFLVQLTQASLRIAESLSGKYTVYLEGTPLRFLIDVENEPIILQLIEQVDYSNKDRILGRAMISRKKFLPMVASLIEKFNSEMITANNLLTRHPAVVSLKKDVSKLS